MNVGNGTLEGISVGMGFLEWVLFGGALSLRMSHHGYFMLTRILI